MAEAVAEAEAEAEAKAAEAGVEAEADLRHGRQLPNRVRVGTDTSTDTSADDGDVHRAQLAPHLYTS